MEITLKAIFFPVPTEFTARSISPPFRNDFGSRQKERFFEQLANVPRVGKQDKIDAFETKTLFGGAQFPPGGPLYVLSARRVANRTWGEIGARPAAIMVKILS